MRNKMKSKVELEMATSRTDGPAECPVQLADYNIFEYNITWVEIPNKLLNFFSDISEKFLNVIS